MSLNIRVITPDRIVWDATAEEIILPSSTGQLGILKDHAPLLTALDIGVMRLKTTLNWTSIILVEGFAFNHKRSSCLIWSCKLRFFVLLPVLGPFYC